MKGRTLTLAVSGQLWNRSLVMIDSETKSLWSHILGQCMRGELEGESLPLLNGDMVTWQAWRTEHPRTTVLNLSRTSQNYAREFYERPEKFVYGFMLRGQPRHATFAELQKTPVLNVVHPDEPLLVTFDKESTLVRIFSRRLGDLELTFSEADGNRMRDEATGSLWDRTTGTAVEGLLQSKQLAVRPGIVSFTATWQTFHPTSRAVPE